MKWCSYEETDPQHAVNLAMLVGGNLNIPQTFRASGFHLIKLNEDEEAVNFTASSSMCSIVNIACSWIKYDETSGFTGDIFF